MKLRIKVAQGQTPEKALELSSVAAVTVMTNSLHDMYSWAFIQKKPRVIEVTESNKGNVITTEIDVSAFVEASIEVSADSYLLGTIYTNKESSTFVPAENMLTYTDEH